MRIILSLAITLLVACTKQNPDLCCVDEADCANVGLDEPLGCADGLLCRGNQCIAEVCGASSECDSAAPYCVDPPDGRCQFQCTDDTQCPGFGEDASQTLCDGGACVECRVSDDCTNPMAPTCDAGRCVACVANDQCASGVCDDGACAAQTGVAYVSPAGSAAGACTSTAPCNSVAFALTLDRPFIVIDSGTYSSNMPLGLEGNRRLIGRGFTRPILRRSTQGPIITTTSSNGEYGLEFLDIAGATGTGIENATAGNAVLCPGGVANNLTIHFVDSILRDNTREAFFGRQCTITATRTVFSNSLGGFTATDSTVTIDRSTFTDNQGIGLNLDAGLAGVTNSVFARNTSTGLKLFLNATTDGTVEFNTIIDNGTTTDDSGFLCDGMGAAMPNNIIVRNTRQTSGTCSFPNSIIVDTNIAPLMFVSPDVAPFDYHIQAGSMAIDAATITTVTHDFDGDPRATNEADVGADEFVP